MADGGDGEQCPQGLKVGAEGFFELVEEGISEYPVSGAEGVMYRNKLKPEWYLDLPAKRKNQKQISWAYDYCRLITDKHPDYEQQTACWWAYAHQR